MGPFSLIATHIIISSSDTAPRYRLIEVLESMFDYKAKGAQSNDVSNFRKVVVFRLLTFQYQSQKLEAHRVVPRLNLGAMVWPPNDQVITEQHTSKRRQIAVMPSSDENSNVQLPSPAVKYTVMKRQWKPNAASQSSQRAYHDEYEETPVHRRRAIQPINYNEDSDQFSSLLESHEAEGSQLATSKTEPFKHTSHTSPVTGAPHRKKARTHIHRPHTTILESPGICRKSSELGNPTRTSSRMTFEASTRQDSRYSAPTEQDDSDDCIEILNFAPPAFDRSLKVKKENPAVKFEALSTEVSSFYLDEHVNSLRRLQCKSGNNDSPLFL